MAQEIGAISIGIGVNTSELATQLAKVEQEVRNRKFPEKEVPIRVRLHDVSQKNIEGVQRRVKAQLQEAAGTSIEVSPVLTVTNISVEKFIENLQAKIGNQEIAVPVTAEVDPIEFRKQIREAVGEVDIGLTWHWEGEPPPGGAGGGGGGAGPRPGPTAGGGGGGAAAQPVAPAQVVQATEKATEATKKATAATKANTVAVAKTAEKAPESPLEKAIKGGAAPAAPAPATSAQATAKVQAPAGKPAKTRSPLEAAGVAAAEAQAAGAEPGGVSPLAALGVAGPIPLPDAQRPTHTPKVGLGQAPVARVTKPTKDPTIDRVLARLQNSDPEALMDLLALGGSVKSGALSFGKKSVLGKAAPEQQEAVLAAFGKYQASTGMAPDMDFVGPKRTSGFTGGAMGLAKPIGLQGGSEEEKLHALFQRILNAGTAQRGRARYRESEPVQQFKERVAQFGGGEGGYLSAVLGEPTGLKPNIGTSPQGHPLLMRTKRSEEGEDLYPNLRDAMALLEQGDTSTARLIASHNFATLFTQNPGLAKQLTSVSKGMRERSGRTGEEIIPDPGQESLVAAMSAIFGESKKQSLPREDVAATEYRKQQAEERRDREAAATIPKEDRAARLGTTRAARDSKAKAEAAAAAVARGSRPMMSPPSPVSAEYEEAEYRRQATEALQTRYGGLGTAERKAALPQAESTLGRLQRRRAHVGAASGFGDILEIIQASMRRRAEGGGFKFTGGLTPFGAVSEHYSKRIAELPFDKKAFLKGSPIGRMDAVAMLKRAHLAEEGEANYPDIMRKMGRAEGGNLRHTGILGRQGTSVTMVGERGPELFVQGQNGEGEIVPTHKMGSFLGRMGHRAEGGGFPNRPLTGLAAENERRRLAREKKEREDQQNLLQIPANIPPRATAGFASSNVSGVRTPPVIPLPPPGGLPISNRGTYEQMAGLRAQQEADAAAQAEQTRIASLSTGGHPLDVPTFQRQQQGPPAPAGAATGSARPAPGTAAFNIPTFMRQPAVAAAVNTAAAAAAGAPAVAAAAAGAAASAPAQAQAASPMGAAQAASLGGQQQAAAAGAKAGAVPDVKLSRTEEAQIRFSRLEAQTERRLGGQRLRAQLTAAGRELPTRGVPTATGELTAINLGGLRDVIGRQRLASEAVQRRGVFGEELGKAEEELDRVTKKRDKATDPQQIQKWDAAVKESTGIVQMWADAFGDADTEASKLSENVVSGGNKLRVFGANTAGVIAGTLLYSTALGAAQAGLQAIVEVAGPAIERMTGFQNVAARVTGGLSDQARQSGGAVKATLAQTEATTGLSVATADLVNSQLEGRVTTEAGNKALQEQFDLVHSAEAVRGQNQGLPADQGLFRTTGGQFGTDIGGVPSTAEFLLKELADIPTAAERAAPPPATIRGPQAIGGRGGGVIPGAGPEQANPAAATFAKNLETGSDRLDVFNNAAEKGGESVVKLTKATEAEADASAALARKGGPALSGIANLLEQRDLAFQGAQKPEDIVNYLQAANVGATRPSSELLLRQASERQIPNQIAAINEEERQITIPTMQAGRFLDYATNRPAPYGAGIVPVGQGLGGVEPIGPKGPGGIGKFPGVDPAATQSFNEYKQIATSAMDAVFAKAQEGRTALEGLGVDPHTIDELETLGKQAAGIELGLANRQASLQAAEYNHELYVLNRSLADAQALTGKRVGSEGRLGQLQRENFDISKKQQALQMQSQAMSLALSQKQINFQRAIAGFRAPGETAEERAARIKEAKIEADYAQRQLNIQKQLFGLGKRSFKIGVQIFDESAKRQVEDLKFALRDLEAQHKFQLDTAAAQQALAAIRKREDQITQEVSNKISKSTKVASAVINQALDIANASGEAFSKIIKQTADAWSKFLTQGVFAVNSILPSESQARQHSGPGHHGDQDDTSGGLSSGLHAGGYFGTVSGATSMIVGEAGTETVAVLRNPRIHALQGPSGGGGGGGGGMIIIDVHDNHISGERDEERIVAQISRAVEKSMNRKGALLSLRSV